MMFDFRQLHPTNKFVGGATLTAQGRVHWRSIGKIDKNDVLEVLRFSSDYERNYIHINSGTDGTKKGHTIFTHPEEFLNNQLYLEKGNCWL